MWWGTGELRKFQEAMEYMEQTLKEKEFIKKYLSVLYDEGDFACFSKNLLGKNCYSPIDFDPNHHQFITLNPCRGGRGNDFVTSYRSFLVEIDSKDVSLEEQYLFFKSIEMPYSCITYSGNKSLHFVISLDRPLIDIESYKKVGAKLTRAIGHPDLDVGIIKKPATFTRAPMAVREENGRVQKLCEVLGRVGRDDFNVWLDKRLPDDLKNIVHKKQKDSRVETKKLGGNPNIYKIRKTELNWIITRDFPAGTRNNRWYRIACQFCEVGYSLDEAFDVLDKYFSEDTDFQYKEWESIIRGVYSKI